MIRALIIEDDPYSLEMLKDLLSDNVPDVKVLDSCDSVEVAVEKIRNLEPDLVFLDVELIDGSGFDVLKKVGTIDFEIIVITSYDKYALTAIKFSALDYLIKPIQFPELETALKKVKKRIPPATNKPSSGKPSRLINKVAVPTLEGLSFIPIQDIIRIESDRNYTVFFMTAYKKLVVTRSMKEYEELFENHGFIRVHNSHMININHLIKYVKGEGGYVVMSDNTTVSVARRRKDDFLNQLDKV